jgi:hypothetical protein
MPERRIGVVVGIEGVHTVVLGDDKQDVKDSLPRNVDVGHIQRLGINLAVDGGAEERPELTRTDSGGSKNRLIEILAGPCEVVVIR